MACATGASAAAVHESVGSYHGGPRPSDSIVELSHHMLCGAALEDGVETAISAEHGGLIWSLDLGGSILLGRCSKGCTSYQFISGPNSRC